jgi:hypothetical protein
MGFAENSRDEGTPVTKIPIKNKSQFTLERIWSERRLSLRRSMRGSARSWLRLNIPQLIVGALNVAT